MIWTAMPLSLMEIPAELQLPQQKTCKNNFACVYHNNSSLHAIFQLKWLILEQRGVYLGFWQDKHW